MKNQTEQKINRKKFGFMITDENENRLRTLIRRNGDISNIINTALKTYLDKVGAKADEI